MQYNKIIFTGVLLLAGIGAHAQFKKGDKMVGTSVASIFFNSGGSDVSFPQVRGYSSKTNSFGIRIEPAFGWFISEKTVIGTSLNINPSSQKIS